MGDDRGVLAEQVEHYRRRAPIYDTWWQRTRRYDVGVEEKRVWFNEVEQVEADLERFGATGSVLELAGGTGWWTKHLARTARSLTVLDSSPEAIALNRQRVGRLDARYVEADLFQWEPRSRSRSSRLFQLLAFACPPTAIRGVLGPGSPLSQPWWQSLPPRQPPHHHRGGRSLRCRVPGGSLRPPT
ncbi:MAG TPA: hypothetical protein DCQ30_11255 [Acidimicrobiaceae bacterium]|nr:hypothetical protein [Acidimicrobiaceae bacterium]